MLIVPTTRAQRTEKQISQDIIFWLLAAMVAVVPLVFSRQVFWQFTLPKLLVMSACLAPALLLTGLKQVTSSTRLAWHPGFALMAIFLATAGLSTLTSVDRAISVFGSYSRQEGFLALLAYGALAWVCFSLRLDNDGLRLILRVAVAAGTIVSAYGLLQFFGLDPIAWGPIGFEANRAFSTFGNPNLNAGYLVVILLIGVGLAFDGGRVNWPWLGASGLVALGLFATLTRGAWVAALTALVVFGIVAFKHLDASSKKALAIAFAGIMAVIFILGAYQGTSDTGVSAVSRLSAITSESGTVATRIEIWKAAGRATFDRPWLGWGPDTLGLVLAKYDTVRSLRLTGPGVRNDNAHNYVLQLASTVGVPGALAFIALVAWATALAFKEGLGKGDILRLGLAAALIGYMVNILFTVNTIGSAFLFWMLLGFALAGGGERTFRHFKLAGTALVGSLSIVLALLIPVVPARVFLADAAYVRGLRAAEAGSIESALPDFERAFRLNPRLDRYHFDLGRFYLDRAMDEGQVADYDAARGHFEDARRLNPLEPNNLLPLAQIEVVRWERARVGDLRRARRLLKRTLELQPLSLDARYLMAVIDYHEGEYDSARALLKDAVRLYPDYARAYELLGAVEKTSGNRAAAERALRKALAIDPGLSGARNKLRELDNENTP